MFVSVVMEIVTDDHQKDVESVLKQYGFIRIMQNVFESAKVHEKTLARLKREIDKQTDSYDRVRFYQYPDSEKQTLVISYLHEKRWKKTTIRQPLEE